MKKNKLLIDGSIEQEIRIALVGPENGLLEYNICKKEDAYVGNIYVARILEIKPSIESAFVDFGNGNTGFLSFDNVHPSNYIFSKNEERNTKTPHIEEVLHKGQFLIVQILKTALQNKCPVVTTYVSLVGSNCIFMPNDYTNSGISRKISGEARLQFKEFINELNEQGVSLIIRTASHAANLRDIKQDYQRLVKLWANIQKTAARKRNPDLVYQEDALLKILRGYSDYSVGSVYISNRTIFKQVQEYIQQGLISFPENLNFSASNVFDKIESEIDKLFEFELPLRSGGSISIHKTEALVSIDVNSRASLKDGNLEETAFNTNMEAVQLIAQQVILRDLSGIIVIDCIDMIDAENIRIINKLTKDCFKDDKAEINILPLSELGLIQISRSRQNASILRRDFEVCRTCSGFGYCIKEDALIMQLLRKITRIGEKNKNIHVYTSHYILQKLLNEFYAQLNHYKIRWEIVDSDDISFNKVKLVDINR